MVTKDAGKENSWTFGRCKRDNLKLYRNLLLKDIFGDFDHKTYDDKCCQPAGKIELICKDQFCDGWHGGYIEIGGEIYCKKLDVTKKCDKNEKNFVILKGNFKFRDIFSCTN
jgi:hypothetical protein